MRRATQTTEAHSPARFASRFWKIILLAFITGFSGAMMPGPFLVAVIEQTPVQGMQAPMVMMTGHALLELGIVILLILGLRPLIAQIKVRVAIGLIGGAALLYMSSDMLRHGWSMSLTLQAGSAVAYSWPKLLLLGVVVSIVNPYFTGWWTMIGAGQMVQMAPKTKLEYFGFYFGHEMADYTWYGTVGLILITGRRWLTDGMYRGMILTCGAILFALGVWFIWTGIQLLKDVKDQKDLRA